MRLPIRKTVLETLNQQQLQGILARLEQVSEEIGKVIVGQQTVINQLLVSILAGGHCLLEGVPGLAKTLMVSSLAKTLELDFQRVQFTPDLMPSDIIGTEILETDHDSGKRFFKFQQGPVFTQILLADEINRTPPKTQAALLEAMQEKAISYSAERYELPKPFFVLATQNPVEQAGTYPLPEAQLDRFLMYVSVGYPTAEDEVEILRRTTGTQEVELQKILSAADIIVLQRLVREVEISEPLLSYVSQLARNTRTNTDLPSVSDTVNQFVQWGAGPRAVQYLIRGAKARCVLHGNYMASTEDVETVAEPVLFHRILTNFHARSEGMDSAEVVKKLVEDTRKENR